MITAVGRRTMAAETVSADRRSCAHDRPSSNNNEQVVA